jgi:outer membrane protein OmpA-like peptidoglycan-associated protein
MRRPTVQGTVAVVACLFIASATARGQSTATLADQLGQGRVVLREIRFVPGSDRINESSAVVLRELARELVGKPGVFLIEGHTDASSDAASAQLLSEQRAVAVKAWLVSEGVAAGRLLAVGYGASRPQRAPGRHNARIEVTRVQ